MIDIDNTIANYSKGLSEFANRILRTHIDWSKGINESERINLGLPDYLYDAIKVVYRLSGEKMHLELIPGAREFINQIKEHYKILIWTARPTHIYPVTKEHTKGWLDQNYIYYDDIIWNGKISRLAELEKWKREIENKGETVDDYEVYAIEDQRSNANQMAQSGIVRKVFLIDWSYNRGELHPNVIRIERYEQIEQYIRQPRDFGLHQSGPRDFGLKDKEVR